MCHESAHPPLGMCPSGRAKKPTSLVGCVDPASGARQGGTRVLDLCKPRGLLADLMHAPVHAHDDIRSKPRGACTTIVHGTASRAHAHRCMWDTPCAQHGSCAGNPLAHAHGCMQYNLVCMPIGCVRYSHACGPIGGTRDSPVCVHIGHGGQPCMPKCT